MVLRRSMRTTATALVVAIAASVGLVSVAPAASAGTTETFRVNSTLDSFDRVCDEADCSLRDAIAQAGPRDRVQVPSGFYTLTRTGAGGVGRGDIDLRASIEIAGVGHTGVFIDASTLGERAFTLGSATVGKRYLLRGITIFGARDPSIDGAAIAIEGGEGTLSDVTIVGSQGSDGGAVWTGPDTAVQIVRSLLLGNEASGDGGAIHADGDLVVNTSTLAGNRATNGGGVHASGRFASFDSSTIAENVATGDGGGAWLATGAAISFTTIADNAAAGRGGGVRRPANAAHEVAVGRSIISGNDATRSIDCAGRIVSTGGNAGLAKGCGLHLPSDRAGIDPDLRGLGPYGGPTPTMALRPGSRAIGAAGACRITDQRGAPRDGRCDAGAYELVRCLGRPVNIVGTRGDDELSGGRGRDVFIGLGGNDEFQGSIGKDRACGGPGDDLLIAGPGNDRFDGEGGNDRIRGETGDDWIWGGPGRDRLVGGPGDDQCQAERGDRRPRGCEILVTVVAGRR
ncbi:MAG: hypothetical protein OEV60_06055 [Actinomycetota bacterium]|nr:hypothetical protein [Actinomycetota bacterium]MDH5223474.1 hypothetical protein [Actinomycetota bacterium]